MTKEEKELKKDVLYCLDKLQDYVMKMSTGGSISAQNTDCMTSFIGGIAIVTDKCKKADFVLK